MGLFKLNDKIELRSKDDKKTPGSIYDIKDEKIYVSISADDENFKLLEMGEKIHGVIYCKQELLSFDARVTDKMFTNVSVYEISGMTNFKKIQRRENIRVIMTKDLLYSTNDALAKRDFNEYDKQGTMEILEDYKDYLKPGLMLDLSAGGLKLSTRENLDMDKRITIIMEFKDEKMILKGKIVHKELNLVPRKTIYLYGIKFVDIKEGQQEKIIRYLFIMMRKNRVK